MPQITSELPDQLSAYFESTGQDLSRSNPQGRYCQLQPQEPGGVGAQPPSEGAAIRVFSFA